MERKIKVTVLTPVYKHDISYVRECFESLRRQTMWEIEFLLIDNGATEESKALIEEFVNKDERFRALHIEVNEGYAKAMNLGIREAKGEYIGILESDDTVDEKMYEDLYEIAKRTDVDVVKSEFNNVVKGVKKPTRHFQHQHYNTVLTDVANTCPLFALGHVCHWSAIYKRDFLIDNNIIFNEDINTGIQDFGFISRVLLYIKSLYITHKAYVNYTMDNPNSSINQKWKMVKAVLVEHQYTMDLYDKENAGVELWEVNIRGKWGSYMHHLSKNVRGHKLEFIKAISKQFRYIIDNKNVELILFKEPEKEILRKIAYHPYQYYASCVLKEMGEILWSTKKLKDCTQSKSLFSILKIKKYSYHTKFYLFGIMFFRHVSNAKLAEYNANRLYGALSAKIDLEKKNLKNELRALIRFDLKTIIQCQNLHKETFGPYKNAFKDKEVVLVASGPTAKYHEQKDGYIYVGVNNACLLDNVKLDYLFCQDFYMSEEKRDAIVNYRAGECQKFFGRIPDGRYNFCLNKESASHVRRCPKYLIDKAGAKEYYVQDHYNNSFALDIENEPLNLSGIVFAAMQFILHCHPKRIYLVGCDCSCGYFYKSDITFDTKGQIGVWQMLKEHMEHVYPDIEIVSLNPVGLRGMFKDEYTENYLEENYVRFVDEENTEESEEEKEVMNV